MRLFTRALTLVSVLIALPATAAASGSSAVPGTWQKVAPEPFAPQANASVTLAR